MNYSRNLNKKKMGKRLVISWVIVAVVAFLLGGMTGYAIKAHIPSRETAEKGPSIVGMVQGEFVVYEAYDDRIFTKEMSLDWGGSGDTDYESLDIKRTVYKRPNE